MHYLAILLSFFISIPLQAHNNDCFPCLDDELAVVATLETSGVYPSRILQHEVFCGKWQNGYVEPAQKQAYQWCKEREGVQKLCTYGSIYSKDRWTCH
jgi:hypothetical protein